MRAFRRQRESIRILGDQKRVVENVQGNVSKTVGDPFEFTNPKPQTSKPDGSGVGA